MIHDLASHTAAQLDCDEMLYKQVALRISELIEHGTLRPGERVPSVRKCSQQQNVSIATVMQAYRLLENRGLIEARPQSGYYVRLQRWTPAPEPGRSKPPPRAVELRGVSDLIMQVIKAGRDPNLVRLGASLPSPELFPIQELHRAMASAGRRSSVAANSYDSPPGNHALRVQIARRAMEAGCTLAPDDIITTVGATEAMNLCLRAVAKPGDVIAIESPTFFGILQIIESLGMRVCELPTYPREGICLDELALRLKTCRIKACLLTPNFSNPLGSCMPDEKKKELVRMLARRQIPLIEDDIYGNLTFGQTRPKVAKAFDEDGWVMLCDSFTKTLSPGYRVGWVAPGRFKERVEFLKFVNTGATPSLPQMAIAEFLQNGGYDHHLRKIRRLYAAQMHCMSQAISHYFPPGTKLTRPTGGMCLWVELPAHIDALRVYELGMAAGISTAPGPIFSAKRKFPNFIRINCGNPWSEKMENAVRQLGTIIESLGPAEETHSGLRAVAN
ncbi:MAG TPA: PLP-dependent aminotransferase family protein [Candidatus Limnocylindrales bacterium]|jgi:DNA-binding transcriptional MocR family regulator|nr:PLP-dependent aminotransferase family protein [Candidatus Limnocylindrales bacterium]